MAVIGDKLQHFWQVFVQGMPMPCCQVAFNEDAKIRLQDTAGGRLRDLFQERNGHFHGAEVFRTALLSQGIGGKALRLNGHPGYAVQIRTAAEDLAGLGPGPIEQHEGWDSVGLPWTLAQACKDRWITVGEEQIWHKAVIPQERHKRRGGSGTVPRKEARVRDGRAY